MKTLLRIRPAVSSLITVILLPAMAHAVTDEAGFLNPALTPKKQDGSEAKPSPAIPWSEIGAKAGAQYQGDGLSVRATRNGAVLRCVFQKLEGEATAEGLWLTSTVPGGGKDRFRVVAAAVQRQASSDMPPGFGLRQSSGAFEPDVANQKRQRTAAVQDAIAATSGQMLPMSGTVQVTDNLVRFVRPGVVEEYSVSMDGVRQDFIIQGPPVGSKTSNIQHPTPNIQSPTLISQLSTLNREELRVELAVSGARVEGTTQGARLVLDGSGRKIAYSRLRVTDATGRELPARMEVASGILPSINHLAILVNDAEAVYPVRIDPTFSDDNWISIGAVPGANDSVRAAVLDASGNLYVGGEFTVIGQVLANRVAKWDGNSWSALGSGCDWTVRALAVSGSSLYVGGSFTNAGGLLVNRIAKWDGNSWSALGSGCNWTVHALAVSGSDLYVGGNFSTAGGDAANGIAKWDGSAWSPLDSGVDAPVEALAVEVTNLYVGGYFTTAGGNPANCVAKWDGSSWSALGSGLYEPVWALAVSGSNVYAGGVFTVGGRNYIARWNGSTWSSVGLGLDGFVRALAISGSNVYAAGSFTRATNSGGSTVTVNRIAKWNGNAWSALGSGISLGVSALAVSGDDVFAGGSFTTAGGIAIERIAKWSGTKTNWSPVGSFLSSEVRAMAVSGNEVYVGGSFLMAGNTVVNRVAKWGGNRWSALGSGVNSNVYALAVLGSNLYVGGIFTNAGGIAANQIAKWDGNSWSALGSGVNGSVNALAASGNDLYAGGQFWMAGGSGATNIARWDGNTWSALGPGLRNSFVFAPAVYALAASGSDVYAGGSFLNAGTNYVNCIAKWDGFNWSALGSGVMNDYPYVYALALSGSNLYAGGRFGIVGVPNANNVAKWNGSTWSALSSGLGNGYGQSVYSLAVAGNDLYAGGDFKMGGNNTTNYLAKWNGTSWSAFGSGVSSNVYALATLGGDLYAGGAFMKAGGKFASYLSKAAVILPANVVSSFPDDGDFVAQFDGTPGITYTIEQTPAASPANWQKLTNLTAPASDTGLGIGVFELRDAVQPSGQRYYRAVYPAY